MEDNNTSVVTPDTSEPATALFESLNPPEPPVVQEIASEGQEKAPDEVAEGKKARAKEDPASRALRLANSKKKEILKEKEEMKKQKEELRAIEEKVDAARRIIEDPNAKKSDLIKLFNISYDDLTNEVLSELTGEAIKKKEPTVEDRVNQLEASQKKKEEEAEAAKEAGIRQEHEQVYKTLLESTEAHIVANKDKYPLIQKIHAASGDAYESIVYMMSVHHERHKQESGYKEISFEEAAGMYENECREYFKEINQMLGESNSAPPVGDSGTAQELRGPGSKESKPIKTLTNNLASEPSARSLNKKSPEEEAAETERLLNDLFQSLNPGGN